MKKYLLALAAALVLCVPAFASDYSGYFSKTFSMSANSSVYMNASTSSDDLYFAACITNSSGDQFELIAISPTSSDTYTMSYSGYFSGSGTNNYSLAYSVGDYYYHKNSPSRGYTSTLTSPSTAFPQNTSMSTIASAFAEFLSSSGGDVGTASSFTLPRGNVLYFQVSTEQDVHFTSYMDTLSNIINFNAATYGAWGDTGQRYGEAASLPTAGTVFPLLSQSPIAWQKDSSTNILGQTKVGLATMHCIVGQWYCFYNPNANHIEGADPYNASPGASVVIEGAFSQIKVYPVNQKLSVVDGDLYSGSNDDFDSYYDGTIDQDGTVSWTNQDGNIEAPAAGGQNFEDGPKSATSLLEGIRVTLETVVHELQTLFTFGYSAIQSLVGIMSDFVSVFSGLYTWLPAEVYSALMSAVVVAIVIGVFKVFL